MTTTRDDLPEVAANSIGGQLGEALVEAAILELGHLYARGAGLDFGIDGTVEIVERIASRPRATGRQIAVQVKRGLSVVRETRYGWTLYCTEAHANYWLGHSLPVIAVHCEPKTKRLRWAEVAAHTIRRTPKGYAIDIPDASDLKSAGTELAQLATASGARAVLSTGKTLLIPYSMQNGVTISDAELGLAALDACRATVRGETYRIEVEVEEEPELVARIDAICDVEHVSDDQRRDAIIHQDILHQLRRQAGKIERALNLLICQPRLAELLGYNESELVAAVRRVARPFRQPPRGSDEVYLQAWRGPQQHEPVVGFDVPRALMDEFYARDPLNQFAIKMGDHSGLVVYDLPHLAFTTCYLPAFAVRLVAYADANNLRDEDVLKELGEQVELWRLGLG